MKRSTMFKLCIILFVIAPTIFCDNSTAKIPNIHSVFLNETIPAFNASLSLVAKCCPVGQYLARREDEVAKCVLSPKNVVFNPVFCVHNESGVLAPGDKKDSFIAIIGDPCQHLKYPLLGEEKDGNIFVEEYYLLENGSIYAPEPEPTMLMPGGNYCIENTDKWGLIPFACFPEQTEVASADFRFTFYAVGLLISVPFLLVTIVAYAATPRLRDIHGKALCCYSACLALAFFTLAISQLASDTLTVQSCVTLAFLIQFSFVACFFWLNVMCVETFLLVQRHVGSKIVAELHPDRLYFYYSLWGWGLPCLLIIISLFANLNPIIPSTYVKHNSSGTSCWFEVDKSAMLFFYVPVGLLVVANVAIFILTGKKLTKYQRNLDLRRLAQDQPSDRKEQQVFRHLRRTFIFCLVLCILMAINWIMELISWGVGADHLAWSAFDLVNALQGILVFGLFVLRMPARTLVWNRARMLCGLDVQEPEAGALGITLLPRNNDSLLGQGLTQ